MRLTRRTLLAGGAAAIAGARAWANTTLSLGAVTVDTLSDGNLVMPFEFQFGDLPENEVREILSRHGIEGDEMTPPCNVTLMRDGTNTVLFDVGAGPGFMPSAGKLWEALDILGVSPEDVTHVVFTHAHPDHLWGVLDDFDDPVFMNARYALGRAERDYWFDPATPDAIGEERLAFAAGALRYLGAIEDALEVVEDGQEILPGIAARMTPGHTPGHMAYEIRGGGEAVMVLGDSILNQHVAFERPDWPSGSDQDPEMAAATRRRLLDQLATDQMAFIGFHLPFPGIGRAEKRDGAYRFVPA